MLTTLGKAFLQTSNGFRYDSIVERNLKNSDQLRKELLGTAPTRKLERLIAKEQKAGATKEQTAVLRGELQRRLQDGNAFHRSYR